MRKCAAVFLWLLAALLPGAAQGQKVEVAPGVSVSRRSYPVPENEAPFFNFAEANEAQKAIDRRFVDGVLQQVPDRAKAAGIAIKAGDRAFLQENDAATAATRYNQARLLDPQQSGIYHGFAMVVAVRFKDIDYADELFRVAARLKSPNPNLKADHGRMLLIAGRPADAKPLLEQAIQDIPDWAVLRMNLAWAVLLTGDKEEACRLRALVKGVDLDKLETDLAMFKQKAGC
jgi:Tfp pilus assembly protein PilF